MTSPFTISDILEGSVGILNNYNLCHIKTIEWNEIITGQNAKYLYVYKFQEKERDCTPCHETCDRGKILEEFRKKGFQNFESTNDFREKMKGVKLFVFYPLL